MSTFEVSVCRSFRAAHALPLGDGDMEESHEHNWETTATFRSRQLKGDMGVVIDFVAVSDAMEQILAKFDGKDLNSLDEFSDVTTSAENLAACIAEALSGKLMPENTLYRLSITEAPGCSAAYYPNDP
ncbi:MAG: 6-carboxytetrahydropterin synthase [bacterium]|nr:6-carboxytetrahydropterin synthase [bacterium]